VAEYQRSFFQPHKQVRAEELAVYLAATI